MENAMNELKQYIRASMSTLADASAKMNQGLKGGVIDEFLNSWIVEQDEETVATSVTFFNQVKEYLEQLDSAVFYEAVESVLESDDESFEFDTRGIACLYILLIANFYISVCNNHLQGLSDNFDEIAELLTACSLDYYDNRAPGRPARKYSMQLSILPPDTMDDVLSKCIKAGMALIPSLSLLFGKLATADSNDTESVLASCILPCALAAGAGFLVGLGICSAITSKKRKKRKEAELENERRYEHWENQVIEAFHEKARDLEFFTENAKEFTSLLQSTGYSIRQYIRKKFAFMPENYILNLAAVSTFRDYLADRRVDSLKEAINLYVEETKTAEFRENQLKAQQEIADAENKLAEEARRQTELRQMELQAQQAYNKAMLEGLSDAVKQMERSNKIEENRIERISELSSKVSDVKDELDRISRS